MVRGRSSTAATVADRSHAELAAGRHHRLHGHDPEPQHGAGGAPTDDTILGIITDTRTGNDAIGPHNPRCLPECEDVGLDAGGEERELECAVGDRAALAN